MGISVRQLSAVFFPVLYRGRDEDAEGGESQHLSRGEKGREGAGKKGDADALSEDAVRNHLVVGPIWSYSPESLKKRRKQSQSEAGKAGKAPREETRR